MSETKKMKEKNKLRRDLSPCVFFFFFRLKKKILSPR